MSLARPSQECDSAERASAGGRWAAGAAAPGPVSGCAAGDCRVCALCVRGTERDPRPGVGQTPTGDTRRTTRHTSARPAARQSALVPLLLIAALVTSVSAKPVKRSWRDPCNLEAAAAAASGGKATAETKLLDQIISVIDVIRPKVNRLMNKFLEQTYPAKDEAEMLRDWGQHNVTWLEFVRETMAAHAAQQSPLSAAGALPRLFADLQRLAVGLERAALEAALTGNGSGLELFRAVQAGLMQLLCELQLALLEKQLEADAARVTDILEHDGPDLDETRERDLRNWVLMREYKAYIGHVHTVVRALREQSAAD